MQIPGSLYLEFAILRRISKTSNRQSSLSGFSSFATISTLVAIKSLSIVAMTTFLSRNLHISANIVKSKLVMLGKFDLHASVTNKSFSLAKFLSIIYQHFSTSAGSLIKRAAFHSF